MRRQGSGPWWGAAAVTLAVTGCGSNDPDSNTSSTGDGGTGGAAQSSGSGAGGEGGVPTPQDFLPAQAYDCRAADVDTPVGARPHADACLYDRGCRSRFIMAHRMGNPFGPENSLSVLRASIQLGVDVAETDIRITADDRVVLIHDAEVDRTLEGSGDVRDLTLAEIQAMALKRGGTDPEGEFGCEHAPSLEEAMEAARGKIVVELETKNIEAAPIAAAYLRDNDLYAWAYVQGNAEECLAAREGADDVPLAFRLESLDDIPALDALDPPPILVEIDDSESIRESPELRAVLEAKDIKLFTNAFVSADLLAVTGDDSQYDAIFERGYDMLQSEVVHLALYSQERIAPR
jgi:glycerophosphoryl diester phosphodiesterase